MTNEPPKCPTCGTHEVSLERTCHNSSCAAYAQEVTVYEGWRVREAGLPRQVEIEAEWAVDAVIARFADWRPTPAMIGFAKAVAVQVIERQARSRSDAPKVHDLADTGYSGVLLS